MSNTKLVLTLVLAIVLGFGGGYLAQMVGGDSDVSDLSNKVDAISEEVSSLQTKVNKMPDDFASFASVDEVSALKSSFDQLEQKVEDTGVGVSGEDVADLKSKVQNLENQMGEIETTGAPEGGGELRVGYINTQEAFTVFTDAVSEEREKAKEKTEEIRDLQANPGEASESDYRKLQAERLKAQLEIDLAMIEKMLSAKGFQEISEDLEGFKNQVQSVVNELDQVLADLEEGTAIPEEVNNTLSQINNMYEQLDSQLTNLIQSKIFQIANIWSEEEGYDLVFRQENVILYPNPRNPNESIDNLTDVMKEALEDELSA